MMNINTNTAQTIDRETLTRLAPSAAATRPHFSTSDKYSFVPTMAVVEALVDTGWRPIWATEAKTRQEHRRGFQKHLVRFAHRDQLQVTDDARLDLLLINSHDTGCAFHLHAGIYRFICSNGMIVGDQALQFSHKHIGFDFDALLASADIITASAGRIGGRIETFKALELTPDEQGVYALAAHQLVYEAPETAPIRAEQLLTTRRSADHGADLWRTFNRTQENVLKGGLRGRSQTGRRQRTRQVKSIDRDTKLNRALWTLTEKMAELKAAQ
jgi:hypothetical protein